MLKDVCAEDKCAVESDDFDRAFALAVWLADFAAELLAIAQDGAAKNGLAA